jgi:hypothetical protein
VSFHELIPVELVIERPPVNPKRQSFWFTQLIWQTPTPAAARVAALAWFEAAEVAPAATALTKKK